MSCEDCDRGEHGVARIRECGAVVCECCRMTIAPYVMEDERPEGKRLSFMEAARSGNLAAYPAFTRTPDREEN